ncbi:MAG: hypothetical protein LBJ73_00925 [Rickettsiales bacterium]|jgi:hypothetical protein|nr:hypothetical protein [Rickettsiales bacterium]
MKKQIDHFLLGLLWLLASTLGACFWFDAKFGFNLFSGAHWRYLGHLQASGTAVRPSFYISLIVIVAAMVAGLYLIARPRFRKIKFKPGPAENVEPATKPSATTATTNSASDARPPRLKLPAAGGHGAAPRGTDAPSFAPMAAPAPVFAPENTPDNFADIEQIFKSAGYTVKKPPRIGGMRPALFAVGADETLWMGAVGVAPEMLAAAADKLNTIFTETLEDIRIDIRAFVINPKTGDAANADNIERFDSVDALRDYMDAHRNRELTDSEKGDFDAYSEYVDTVADYFNKS